MSNTVNFNVSADDLTHHVACNLALYADVDRAIVYVPAVDTINVFKEQLAKKDVHCAVYSGSFTDVENSDNFSSWRDRNVAVMVATCAFGVGIDYPTVRTVFLYGLPYTV